ncbi:hypothetical protein C453_14823 [Haloferax elongans ATCC BAA-1513]|uniref:Uncharacterized protein n=1 Tax=Haloferax elongans ATCC BAA-1513 TaxID=1230453 RepID=M0HEZ6_HALEO|nr:hypothetical protein [Haloferax elongans]ELZ82368.1 hypothetical protein C453_14823 [Haloferax elongans ATCC BAA-1513]
MSGGTAFTRRLLSGMLEMGDIVVFDLLFGGDLLTSFSAVVGIALFAIAFGTGDSLLVAALVAAAKRTRVLSSFTSPE